MENSRTMSHLSTGQASKLLSVTPDTILKWIKQGRLPAFRTAGGHYRIALEDIHCLKGDMELYAPAMNSTFEDNHLYCWEFFSDNGSIRKACQNCLAYRAGALRCFEMSYLTKEMGFNGSRNSGSCDDCSYFRYQQGRPYNILVITDNDELKKSLVRERGKEKIIFQFASCEYECALLIDRFRPDFVLVDCEMEEEKCRELCHHLANDPRIHRSTIILATPARRLSISFPGTVRIKHPFSLKEIEKCLKANKACRSIQFALNNQ